jgi:hypothetical protein
MVAIALMISSDVDSSCSLSFLWENRTAKSHTDWCQENNLGERLVRFCYVPIPDWFFKRHGTSNCPSGQQIALTLLSAIQPFLLRKRW